MPGKRTLAGRFLLFSLVIMGVVSAAIASAVEGIGIKALGVFVSPNSRAYVILLAFDRTVTNTGGLKWGYMNKILSNWKEKDLRTVAEIEEKDSRGGKPAKAVSADKPIDPNKLRDKLRDI